MRSTGVSASVNSSDTHLDRGGCPRDLSLSFSSMGSHSNSSLIEIYWLRLENHISRWPDELDPSSKARGRDGRAGAARAVLNVGKKSVIAAATTRHPWPVGYPTTSCKHTLSILFLRIILTIYQSPKIPDRTANVTRRTRLRGFDFHCAFG